MLWTWAVALLLTAGGLPLCFTGLPPFCACFSRRHVDHPSSWCGSHLHTPICNAAISDVVDCSVVRLAEMLGVNEGIISENRHTKYVSECGSIVCTETNGSLRFCRLQIPATDPATLIEGFVVQLLLHSQFCICCLYGTLCSGILWTLQPNLENQLLG